MKRLTSGDFPEFFKELHDGTAPFPWQCRLANLVTGGNGSWPRQIALPTASGKTACIDIALFALACAAYGRRSGQLKAPRRIFFVVDRRIIVDQAFERAVTIRDLLLSANSGLLKAVAENLRELAVAPHDESPSPLECFQLRGGVYRDDGWARSPLQPIVVCSTVDQLGSRLLFRGYGRSSKVAPVFAGLAANDSLILLDEAHCSVPFAETAEAARRYCGPEWAEQPPVAPLSVAVMSATLRYDVESPFRLDEDDYADERLARRLLCDKFAQLADEIKAKTATRAFAEALAKEAHSLADRGAKRVAIMVNRVQTAKYVFELLKGIPSERKGLFIGRMRPLDSQRLNERWKPNLQSNSERVSPADPVFIVATQCLEVGADFDFDGLVCECASLDALRQRFGRLKRLGLGNCWATIMIAGEDAKDKSVDPIYGTALSATWRWLKSHAQTENGERRVNMGVQAIAQALSRLSSEELNNLVPAARHAPVLLPSHIDCLVQTSPVPEPDPDVSLFLHGNEDNIPEIQICWRADLDVGVANLSDLDEDHQYRLAESWIASLSLCPPSAAECMSVPLWLVRRWLAREKIEKGSLGDVDGVKVDVDASHDDRLLLALRWCGPDDDDTGLILRPNDIRPGDTIVVPAEYGGWSEFGHIPNLEPNEPGTDLGDEANYLARRRPVLRIYPDAPRSWRVGSGSLDNEAFQAAASDLLDLSGAKDELTELFTDEQWRTEVKHRLAQLAEVDGIARWLRDAARALSVDASHRGIFYVHPFATSMDEEQQKSGLILVGRRRAARSAADTFTGEDETSTATANVPLAMHLSGVAEMAERFASGCGLSLKIQQSLALAGRLHDIGKVDVRFQAWLRSGNLTEALVAQQPLAKSSGREDRRAREAARRRSGYPRGGRHELLSLQLAEKYAAALLNDEVDGDLVLHLIGCHHGFCRPFAPHVRDNLPPDVSWQRDGLMLELRESERNAWNPARLDSGIANRFWRLVRRYGWWGLAWLESIFILADWRESEREMEQDGIDAGGIAREEVLT